VTIIIGSAFDIVTHCNVPRYLHNNFPLGNPLGPPYDRNAQRRSVETALTMAGSSEPVVKVSTLRWPNDTDWRSVYGKIDDSNREHLAKIGAENRRTRAANKAQGLVR
jgi:hypothetical protein